MIRKYWLFLLLLWPGICTFGQGEKDSTETKFLSRIFLPAIDIGYQVPTSDLIEGSVRVATSIEHRFRNNNDFFVRINYDTYGAKYRLGSAGNNSNVIEGTVQISDVFLAPGYRFGDRKVRFMFSIMPGIKFYEYPQLNIEGNSIQLSLKSESIFTTSFLGTLEYYFDQKTALTISLYQNQVWEDADFWQNGRAAYGFSLGFITSLL